MKHYPSSRYHPEHGHKLVQNEVEDVALGEGWFHSPADFGVETTPGKTPDPQILANKSAFEAKRPPKVAPNDGMTEKAGALKLESAPGAIAESTKKPISRSKA